DEAQPTVGPSTRVTDDELPSTAAPSTPVTEETAKVMYSHQPPLRQLDSQRKTAK
ncbi:hypothetical protein LSAT2_025477, partial [Lamellibrachia satsuma]